VEYADAIEALARHRCAQTFAANGVSAEEIYVNVQPLSGAPANNAVYHALVNPGDTIMGMNLLHGGHLTHGSSVNRSGKYYNAVHYTIDPQTEQIDYDQVQELASSHKPKFIIAGYSSYPWTVDWARFHEIAVSVNAFLFADIAHVAGLVAAGVYPSPVGYADVITFTTHKSLCGPRGACILTTDPRLAHKVDKAVFPGEQGGPHVNVFAAMALTFKLAQTEQFHQLQKQVVKNCVVFTDQLKDLGFRIPYGGTNTHLMNLDCGSIHGETCGTLSGDQAARILDIAGIVVNRNTIPGDRTAADPSGIRMGTPWVTQRGFKEEEMIELADILSSLLRSITPYTLETRRGLARRAKVDFSTLEKTKLLVRELALKAGMDFDPSVHGYPHFYYLDDEREGKWLSLELGGERIGEFLNFALSSDVETLLPGQSQATRIYTPQSEVNGFLTREEMYKFRLDLPGEESSLVSCWLRDLSDGFIAFDDDVLRRMPGPIWVKDSKSHTPDIAQREVITSDKPYFIGMSLHIPESVLNGKPLPRFIWEEKERALRRTPVYETHKQLSAKLIPFAGWEMPVWYSSVIEEHLAVRQAAGIFDVAHMGVYQFEGAESATFLDGVSTNDVGALKVGESCYTQILDPDAKVIDDAWAYRRDAEKYLVVVNASNDDKDWAWLNAVKDGMVLVNKSHPSAKVYGRKVLIRNLRDPKEGRDMRVDIALQGPRSRDILLAMGVDSKTRKLILGLTRTQLCEAFVGGMDLIVSRTGYTGEKMAFELFVHPDDADRLFKELLKVGEPLGLKPIGLGARDSLRTEAGLPLYGHEMGSGSGKLGQRELGVAEAGFGSYVKTYKPWFIGREAFLEYEKLRRNVVCRFRFSEKGVRVAHNGDPVLDRKGKVIGWVTSCAIDSESYLTGQALVDFKNAEEGTPIYIYQSAPEKSSKAPAELSINDKSILPSLAVVISRFPKWV
jgi:glycine hydroxymethyltransferase